MSALLRIAGLVIHELGHSLSDHDSANTHCTDSRCCTNILQALTQSVMQAQFGLPQPQNDLSPVMASKVSWGQCALVQRVQFSQTFLGLTGLYRYPLLRHRLASQPLKMMVCFFALHPQMRVRAKSTLLSWRTDTSTDLGVSSSSPQGNARSSTATDTVCVPAGTLRKV